MSLERVFDESGKELDLESVVRKFLVNNLRVDISSEEERDYSDSYIAFKVSLLLCDEEISSAYTSVNI